MLSCVRLQTMAGLMRYVGQLSLYVLRLLHAVWGNLSLHYCPLSSPTPTVLSNRLILVVIRHVNFDFHHGYSTCSYCLLACFHSSNLQCPEPFLAAIDVKFSRNRQRPSRPNSRRIHRNSPISQLRKFTTYFSCS